MLLPTRKAQAVELPASLESYDPAYAAEQNKLSKVRADLKDARLKLASARGAGQTVPAAQLQRAAESCLDGVPLDLDHAERDDTECRRLALHVDALERAVKLQEQRVVDGRHKACERLTKQFVGRYRELWALYRERIADAEAAAQQIDDLWLGLDRLTHGDHPDLFLSVTARGWTIAGGPCAVMGKNIDKLSQHIVGAI